MAKDELIRELATEMGLDEDEAEALLAAVQAKRKKRETALAKRDSEEIAFPVGPTGGSRAIARGRDMYGDETPAEAKERWMDQEMDDPEGAYGPGGMTSGGIFGEGSVAMPDYDPTARARTENRLGGRVQLRILEVLERFDRRLEAAEKASGALPAPQARQLPKRGGRGR